MTAPKLRMRTAAALFFQNYTNFSGRSRRSEFWLAMLFYASIYALLDLLPVDITWLWTVVCWIPGMALQVRRLHDIGRSGWWFWLYLIPLAGPIVILIWNCKDSQAGYNQWGPSPKYR